MKAKHTVYAAMKALGGTVPDQATWRCLGQAAGYSAHRDLAGFYGGRVPSMVCHLDGSRSLTATGWARASSQR